MIAIGLVIIVLVSLAATPWRHLSADARTWTIVAAVNTATFLAMPSTAATSPGRSVVANVMAASAAMSLVLLASAFFVRQRGSTIGVGPLVLCGLPFAFYAVLFWLIGPVY